MCVRLTVYISSYIIGLLKVFTSFDLITGSNSHILLVEMLNGTILLHKYLSVFKIKFNVYLSYVSSIPFLDIYLKEMI